MQRWLPVLLLLSGCARSDVSPLSVDGDALPAGDGAPGDPTASGWVLIDDFNRPDATDPGNGWTLILGGNDRTSLANSRLVVRPVSSYPDAAIFRPASEALENLRARVIFNTTDPTNYPQIWTRVVDDDVSASTSYLFYVSTDVGDEIGVIRHLDGSWDQNWTAPHAILPDRDYRLEVRAENASGDTEVELEMCITDLTTGGVIFNRLWVDSGPGIILGAGRQALSGYSHGELRYDDFEIMSLD